MTIAELTILECIEHFSGSVFNLIKKGNKAIKLSLLYQMIRDFIRAFGRLAELLPTPYHIPKQLNGKIQAYKKASLVLV